MPLDEVKGAWADDLRGFTVEQIKYGLSMLGERPPNLIQFKDLCKKAPQYFDSLQLSYRPTPSEEKLAKFRRAYSKITLCYQDPEGFIGNVEEFRKED
jgi:hypothetical protein